MFFIDKAVGHDSIPAFFLKVTRHVITLYLIIPIQFSFDHGSFPANCKIAREAPLYKSAGREDPTNHRPISILTCFSEIFEKLIYVSLNNFFSKISSNPFTSIWTS